MDFRIVEEKENRVLGRTEVSFEVAGAKNTPSRKEIRKRIAALKNSKEEVVSVVAVKQQYGEHRATGLAFVYKNVEALKRIEPGYLAKRENKEKKEKPAGKTSEGENPAEQKEETPGKKE